MNVAGGAELQRVLYSLACRQLLPDTKPLVARLIYFRPRSSLLLSRIRIEPGAVYPGIATMLERFGRIALPAATGYLERKSNAIREVAGPEIAAYWGTK